MSDVVSIVQAHQRDVEDVAAQTGLPEHLVHLVAVLILSGLRDDIIVDEVRSHIPAVDGNPTEIDHVAHAAAALRARLPVLK